VNEFAPPPAKEGGANGTSLADQD